MSQTEGRYYRNSGAVPFSGLALMLIVGLTVAFVASPIYVLINY